MRTVKGAWRFLAILYFSIVCLMVACFKFPKVSHEQQQKLIRDYSRRILKAAGVTINTEGVLPVTEKVTLEKLLGLTVVSNHVSWLDIFSIDSVCPCHFVAKSEIAKWPVFGAIAQNIGTLFINRASRTAIVSLNKQIGEDIENGEYIALFAEGTTSYGNELLPLKSNFLAPATMHGSDIQPVIISYTSKGKPTKEMAFAGDVSLLGSLWNVVSTEDAGVTVHFLEKISTVGLNRHEVRDLCEKAMRAKLQEIWGDQFKATDPKAAAMLANAIKNG